MSFHSLNGFLKNNKQLNLLSKTESRSTYLNLRCKMISALAYSFCTLSPLFLLFGLCLELCFQIRVEVTFILVPLPYSHLTLSRAVISRPASTTALRGATLRLPTRQRTPRIAAEADLWYALDLFV